MDIKKKITPSLEDYLETIWFLFKRNGQVRVTDIAQEMNISKPSVNKAINILKTDGFVDHEHYGTLSLTERGETTAKSVADRHNILKCFLHDILKIEETLAEEEACKIEHFLSFDTTRRIGLLMKQIENTEIDFQ